MLSFLLLTIAIGRSPDMAVMHQDTSEDYEIIDEKLTEIFGVGHLNQNCQI